MNITGLIKHRLNELGHEQRDLAAAAQLTESYISRLQNLRDPLDFQTKESRVREPVPGRAA